jgi:hypothetical protein
MTSRAMVGLPDYCETSIREISHPDESEENRHDDILDNDSNDNDTDQCLHTRVIDRDLFNFEKQ